MNHLDPQRIQEAIQKAIDEVSKEIVDDEANKAAERVKQRIIMEASKIGFRAEFMIASQTRPFHRDITIKVELP